MSAELVFRQRHLVATDRVESRPIPIVSKPKKRRKHNPFKDLKRAYFQETHTDPLVRNGLKFVPRYE